MSAEVDIIGQQARSREGRGLSMRSGDSDKWIDIQKNTFMNWVNLQLQGSGYEVKDFEQDFDSGVTLCALVEALQQRRIGKSRFREIVWRKVIKKPMNQHQSLENVTLALKAIAEDNVRLVNIGSEDIVNGSQKLILGLVWHLILRYQIGKTKFPPKKLMLAWLQAVIPDCRISNFTSDWNDGVALSALIEYCQPGLCPEWRQLSRQNRLENCTQAMNLAHQHLNIPMVVRPEDLASPHLDDLSGMTYLSYYMMQDSPGYYATRREIRNILQTGSFDNFTTDWEDGRLLCDLVKSVGGEVPGWPNLSNDRVENLQKGLDAGKRLGIGPIITAGEMADPEGEHLGIMAYAAYYTKLKPVKLVAKPPTFSGNLDNAYVAVEIKEEVKTQAQAEATRQEEEVEEELSEAHEAKESEMVVERHRGQGYNFEQMVAINAEDSPTSEGFDSQSPRSEPDEGEFPDAAAIRTVFEGTFDDVMCHQEKTFQIHLEDGSPDDIHAVLTGPNSSPPVHMQWSGSTASCSFTPVETGQHKLDVLYDNKSIAGCPVHFKVNADRSRVVCSPPDRACVGYPTDITVDISKAGQGDMRVEARSPSGRVHNVPALFRSGAYDAGFTPDEVGVWEVSVLYEGDHISGSPFHLRAFDPSLVQVYGLEGGAVGRTFTFNADSTQAGEGEVKVKVNYQGSEVSAHLVETSRGEYKVDFDPQGPGQYRVSVYMNDMEVRGSPYTLEIVDSSQVTLSGQGLSLVPVDMATTFTINTKGAGADNINVTITTPSGKLTKAELRQVDKETVEVEYLPTEAGDHQISVEFYGQAVKGSPFISKAYNTGRLKVTNMPAFCLPGSPVSFDIDASQAGSGNIEIRVNGGRVACSVQNRGNHCFTASFVPEHAHHLVEMTFNDQEVDGSPWKIPLIDLECIRLSSLNKAVVEVDVPACLTVHCGQSPSDQLTVSIKDPQGEYLPFEKRVEKDGDVSITYTPREVGDHQISVHYLSQEVSGSPITAKAYNTKAITVTSLEDGFVGQPMAFTIDVHAAGEGQLQIMVNNGNIPNEVNGLDQGVYRIQFVPVDPGMQQVDIFFNDEALSVSPLRCEARALEAEVSELSQLVAVNTENVFALKSAAAVTQGSEVIILSPTGDHLDANLVENMDGDYRVEWTPKEPGRHSVDVLFAGQRVKGSPFYIEVFDITKIRVDNFFNGNVGEQAGFSVDTSRAGKCEQTVHVVGPTGRGIPVHVAETSTYGYNVTYEPSESGQHRIFLTYNSLELPGSPFTQEIGEGVLPPAYGDGLHRGEEDKAATFFIDARGMTGEPFVQVDGPNSIAKCSIEAQPDGQYMVTYIPVEVGMFDALVKWNGKELPGSPFHPKVVCARKVQVVGGWQHYMDSKERIHLVVNEEKNIPFEVAEAGPGKLTAEVKGPSGLIPVTVDDSTVGRSTVVFTPREEGIHSVYLYWSDTPLVNSPFQGYATSGALDPSKVILTGRGLKEAIVREEAEFMIDASQAGTGEPEVQLTGVRAEVNVFVTPLGGGKFRCTYIPVVPGAYLLHISWNGRQLRGSPYKVNIIGAFYPHKVIVSGEGLKGGLLGRDFDIRIDTRKAGPGELTAYCVGPSKVAHCELEDHHDGTFRLLVRPQEAGRHKLQVKYGGEHVTGSPFEFKVSAQPDASKVRVSGPGVEHGILATFQSRFVVETRGAGAGQLTVRIRGPKGAFQVEMYRDSQKDRTILCRYDPTETGLYIISVRWSGVDVPGSPFHVHILDTQSELEQVLADPPPFHNTSFPSSRASGTGQQWREEF
ncbi:filamin-A-like isoform X7 [Babylonia areolata]|uniref:filamin-A-like isoform X6 n=1 Tax=Babylonia areolata TaxID=304850 RepID=UPI003FD49D2A